MKQLLILISCFFSNAIIAETIGNVEFQFPPSNYEWKLLTSDSQLKDLFDLIIQQENAEEGEESEENLNPFDSSKCQIKVYTHREGDALEFFFAIHKELDTEEGGFDAESASLNSQALFENTFKPFLAKLYPNHQFSVTHSVADNIATWSWELNDGANDLMHGYMRFNEKTVLYYVTTAQKTECNQAVWTNVLKQATLFE